MGRFLPCPLPCHSGNHQDSDLSQPATNLHSDSSSNSSSLTSQPSLPSIPSLTPHSQITLDPPNSTTAAAARHHCSATLKSHSSYIFSLALAGKNLYSGDSNGETRVWDSNPYNSNDTVSEVHRHSSAVKSIVVLDDKLITAHHDHKIRVWRIDTNHQKHFKIITTLPTPKDRCMRFFSAKSYVEVRRHKKCTWVHHADVVSSLALSCDGLLLYSVSWDRSFKVWRTSDFKCVESVQNAHDDAINAVVLSSAGDGHVYTGSADKSIRVWKRNADEKKHALVCTLEKHKSAVNALALSSDGAVLYSGACDRSIIVWDKGGAAHMTVIGALRGHRKAILCLAVVSELLCSGSADKTVRVWRRESGGGKRYDCLAVFEGHNGPVKCLTAALDNRDGGGNSYVVYSGGLDFDIKVWQLWVPF